jgi:SSS family solute:Na+ symporter
LQEKSSVIPEITARILPGVLAVAGADESIGLTSIDFTVLGVYLLGVLAIGIYFSRYIRSAGDFFLAGKALPFWAIGMSIVVSDIGAIDLVAGAGAAYKYGVAQANFDWLGSMPAMVLAAFIFVPYYWRSGVYTIPEFLGRRYNRAVQLIQAVIWLIFLTSMLAFMLWTSAKFLNAQLDWKDPRIAIWLTVAFVGIYTMSGGLAAVVMTDVVQMIVMFVGTAALVVLCLWNAGGWSNMVEIIQGIGAETRDHFELFLPHDAPTPYPWTGIVFGLGLVLSTSYFVGNQGILQRVLGARSEWDAKAGMLFAGFLKLFVPILIMLPGLAARVSNPDLDDPDKAVPYMVRELFPPGLLGLMFAAFIAALMSSVDSYLNSAVTVFTSDLYTPAYRKITSNPLPERHGLILGRALTVGIIVAAGIVAPIIGERADTIYVGVQTMLSLFQGPTLALLLLGILWPRANGWGALSGLVLGLCLTSSLSLVGDEVFPSEDPFLFVSLWSFVFSCVVIVVVSLLTRPEPKEKIRGLVFGQVMHDVEAQEILRRRVDGEQ